MFNFIFMPYDGQASTGMKIPWKVARELQSGSGLILRSVKLFAVKARYFLVTLCALCSMGNDYMQMRTIQLVKNLRSVKYDEDGQNSLHR